MKKLDFAQFGDKKDRMFSALWLAFRVTFPAQAKGYEQLKLCNRLGEKLEAMSKPAPTPVVPECKACGRPPELGDASERVPTRSTLLLLDMEHQKLLAMVKSEEIGWSFQGGRNVEALVAALEAAPEVEVEEKAGRKKGRKG